LLILALFPRHSRPAAFCACCIRAVVLLKLSDPAGTPRTLIRSNGPGEKSEENVPLALVALLGITTTALLSVALVALLTVALVALLGTETAELALDAAVSAVPVPLLDAAAVSEDAPEALELVVSSPPKKPPNKARFE
jgi:hypothetical protein